MKYLKNIEDLTLRRGNKAREMYSKISHPTIKEMAQWAVIKFDKLINEKENIKLGRNQIKK